MPEIRSCVKYSRTHRPAMAKSFSFAFNPAQRRATPRRSITGDKLKTGARKIGKGDAIPGLFAMRDLRGDRFNRGIALPSTCSHSFGRDSTWRWEGLPGLHPNPPILPRFIHGSPIGCRALTPPPSCIEAKAQSTWTRFSTTSLSLSFPSRQYQNANPDADIQCSMVTGSRATATDSMPLRAGQEVTGPEAVGRDSVEPISTFRRES